MENPITIRHPAYPDDQDQNVLIRLRTFDEQGRAVHVGFALTVCALIANNAFDGYFAASRDGPRLGYDWDDFITIESLYFIVPFSARAETGASEQEPVPSINHYAVCPDFEAWTFPHTSRPHLFRSSSNQQALDEPLTSQSSLGIAVARRDKSCTVSGKRDYREAAHLCPRSASAWFQLNRMSRYCLNEFLADEYSLDDGRNALALRMDIHRAFDERKFCFIPTSSASRWRVQFVQPTADLGADFHGNEVDIHPDVAPEFCLVRLAWTIFPLVRTFFLGTVGKKVTLPLRTSTEEGYITETWNWDKYQEHIARPRRPGSESPKKRKKAERTATDAREDFKRCKFSAEPAGLEHRPSTGSTDAGEEDVATPGSSAPHHITILAREWRKRGRPTDEHLICCNYDLAEVGEANVNAPAGYLVCERCGGLDTSYDYNGFN